MKTSSLRFVFSFCLILIVSCDEPETVVTNFVYRDGSIRRTVEMRSGKQDFRQSQIQVPVDSTWTIEDTLTISEKGDTTWIRTAEKLFGSAAEINTGYSADSSCNSRVKRQAALDRKFRWFNTIYRYSEKIDRIFSNGYPVSEFLNEEELLWYYTPWNEQEAKRNGIDSTKYRALSDSVNRRTNDWFFNSVVAEWIYEFTGQIQKKDQVLIAADTLKAWEKNLLSLTLKNEQDFDTQWENGSILEAAIGRELSMKYRSEADSSLELVEEKIGLPFKQYSMRIAMPGKLIGSNGFADSCKVLLWTVSSDYFLTEDYVMWAESRVANIWAWIMSGAFVVFVFTGLIIRKKKRD